jgi:predicted phosphodiesterase
MILVIGDIHFSHKAPIGRKSSYPQDILNKFQKLKMIAYDNDCKAVIQTGDIFHRKGNTTYKDLSVMMSEIKSWPLPWYGISGNHDCPSGYEEDSAIGCLFKSGIINKLGAKVTFIQNLSITGVDWNPTNELSAYTYSNYFSDVLVTHAMFSNIMPWNNAIHERGWIDTGKIDYLQSGLIVNGHNHQPFEDKNIINIGSLTRTFSNQNHFPRVLIIKEDKSYYFVDVPVEKMEDVIREKVEECVDDYQIRQSVNAIKVALLGSRSSPFDVFDSIINSFNLNSEQIELIHKYVKGR